MNDDVDDRLRRCLECRLAVALRLAGLLRLQRLALQPAQREVRVLRVAREAGVLREADGLCARFLWQRRRLQLGLHPKVRAVHARVLRRVVYALRVGRVACVLREEDVVRVLREQQPVFLRVAHGFHAVRALHAVRVLRVACVLRRDDRCGCGFAGDRCDVLRCEPGVRSRLVFQPRLARLALLW